MVTGISSVPLLPAGNPAATISSGRLPEIEPLKRIPGSKAKTGYVPASLIMKVVGGNKKIPINVDVIGVGSSVYDILVGRGYAAHGVNFAMASYVRDQTGMFEFINKRAEVWWRFREALDPETGSGIALPDDPALKADLCAPRWQLTPRGIKVEEKEDIIKRIGRSPDSGEAVILAYYTIHTYSEPITMDEIDFEGY